MSNIINNYVCNSIDCPYGAYNHNDSRAPIGDAASRVADWDIIPDDGWEGDLKKHLQGNYYMMHVCVHCLKDRTRLARDALHENRSVCDHCTKLQEDLIKHINTLAGHQDELDKMMHEINDLLYSSHGLDTTVQELSVKILALDTVIEPFDMSINEGLSIGESLGVEDFKGSCKIKN